MDLYIRVEDYSRSLLASALTETIFDHELFWIRVEIPIRSESPLYEARETLSTWASFTDFDSKWIHYFLIVSNCSRVMPRNVRSFFSTHGDISFPPCFGTTKGLPSLAKITWDHFCRTSRNPIQRSRDSISLYLYGIRLCIDDRVCEMGLLYVIIFEHRKDIIKLRLSLIFSIPESIHIRIPDDFCDIAFSIWMYTYLIFHYVIL